MNNPPRLDQVPAPASPSPRPAPPVTTPTTGTVGTGERPWEQFFTRPARALERQEAKAILDDLASRGWLHVDYAPVNMFATYPGARLSAVTVNGAPFFFDSGTVWDLRVAVMLYRMAFFLARDGVVGLWVQGYRPLGRRAYGPHDQGRALDIFGVALPAGVLPPAPFPFRTPRDIRPRMTGLDLLLIHDYWANLPLRAEPAEGSAPVVGHVPINQYITQHASSFSSASRSPRRSRLAYTSTPTFDADDYRSLTGRAIAPDAARRSPSEQAAFEAMRARLVKSNQVFSTILKVVYANASLSTHFTGQRGSQRVGSGLAEDPGTARGVQAADILTWDEVVHPDYRGSGRTAHQDHIHAPIGTGGWMRDYDDGWPTSTPSTDAADATPGPRGTVDPRDRAAAANAFATATRGILGRRYADFQDPCFDPVRALIGAEVEAESSDAAPPGPGGAPAHFRVLRAWATTANYLPPRRSTTDAADRAALATEVQAALEAKRAEVLGAAAPADHAH